VQTQWLPQPCTVAIGITGAYQDISFRKTLSTRRQLRMLNPTGDGPVDLGMYQNYLKPVVTILGE
jgi:hypothetical protein